MSEPDAAASSAPILSVLGATSSSLQATCSPGPGVSQPNTPTTCAATDPIMVPQQAGNVPLEFYSHMITVMQSMSERLLRQPSDKVKITDVFLPSYDPDGNVGVREWCKHISTAKNTYQLGDYDIRMKVTSLLKGRAKIWADNWLVTTSTWDELQQNIITTFEPESRYSRDVLKFREHVYDPSKNIAEFLTQSWILWRRVTKDKLENSDAVEAVIGTIGDERLRIELMNARATSVPELISVVSSIRVKRPSQQQPSQPPQKRSRFSVDNRTNPPYCNCCKVNGHTFSNCRNKSVTDSNMQPTEKNPATPSSRSSSLSDKLCSFCGKNGHTFDTCFRRERQITSNVNSVSNKGPSLNTMRMQVGNMVVNTVFDSGAECSVMRETVANKLPGRRHQEVCYLRRILIALRESGFSINIDKCLFFKRSIEYLGNVIEDGQVRPSPKKIEALLKAPVPTTVKKKVRQFNGLAGYFRRFIPDFA